MSAQTIGAGGFVASVLLNDISHAASISVSVATLLVVLPKAIDAIPKIIVKARNFKFPKMRRDDENS